MRIRMRIDHPYFHWQVGIGRRGASVTFANETKSGGFGNTKEE